MTRKVIHVDMDAFYASVEQRDNPDFRGRPLVVGGSPESRGVVAACSYEARQFGIHSAMACSVAYRLCPQTIFVRPRFETYKSISRQIRNIFFEYTDLIEPLSLDEAYLDVSQSVHCDGSAVLIAEEIRRKIFEQTQLTASAGVSYNKFIAKVASDVNKPNGITIVLPKNGERFVAELSIGQFFGIGPVTEKKMHSLGIKTGADLHRKSLDELIHHFGRSAQYYYQVVRGIDERPVETGRERKSIGAETTFEKDITDTIAMLEVLENLMHEVADSLHHLELRAKTLTIKVKYADFTQVTRSYSPAQGFEVESEMADCFTLLLKRTEAGRRAVRLLGVSLSNFQPREGTRQLPLPFS